MSECVQPEQRAEFKFHPARKILLRANLRNFGFILDFTVPISVKFQPIFKSLFKLFLDRYLTIRRKEDSDYVEKFFLSRCQMKIRVCFVVLCVANPSNQIEDEKFMKPGFIRLVAYLRVLLLKHWNNMKTQKKLKSGLLLMSCSFVGSVSL
uniref:Uncharacterized protein n=1 Tax=Cacopsylla melanoneura TaxID=428564 RepID=A0A8D9F5G4_9HEMI